MLVLLVARLSKSVKEQQSTVQRYATPIPTVLFSAEGEKEDDLTAKRSERSDVRHLTTATTSQYFLYVCNRTIFTKKIRRK